MFTRINTKITSSTDMHQFSAACQFGDVIFAPIHYFPTTLPMDSHFLSPEKLQKIAGRKIEYDVAKGIQSYAEKIITDIINRSTLLSRHYEKDIIDASEISVVVEKDFDYSFGLRNILEETNTPTNEHIEKIAEISRQRY